MDLPGNDITALGLPETRRPLRRSRSAASVALEDSRSGFAGHGHHQAIHEQEHQGADDSDHQALPVETVDVPAEERVAEKAADRRSDDADQDGNGHSSEASRLAGILARHDELRDGPRDEAEQAPQ